MNMNDPYAGERLKESHFHAREAALNIRDIESFRMTVSARKRTLDIHDKLKKPENRVPKPV